MAEEKLSERLDQLTAWFHQCRTGEYAFEDKGARTFECLLEECAEDARLLEGERFVRQLRVVEAAPEGENVIPFQRPEPRAPLVSTYDPDGAA